MPKKPPTNPIIAAWTIPIIFIVVIAVNIYPLEKHILSSKFILVVSFCSLYSITNYTQLCSVFYKSSNTPLAQSNSNNTHFYRIVLNNESIPKSIECRMVLQASLKLA